MQNQNKKMKGNQKKKKRHVVKMEKYHESIKECNSKSKGYHLYIKIKPAINPTLANFLQWLFGDDSKRAPLFKSFSISFFKKGVRIFLYVYLLTVYLNPVGLVGWIKF